MFLFGWVVCSRNSDTVGFGFSKALDPLRESRDEKGGKASPMGGTMPHAAEQPYQVQPPQPGVLLQEPAHQSPVASPSQRARAPCGCNKVFIQNMQS